MLSNHLPRSVDWIDALPLKRHLNYSFLVFGFFYEFSHLVVICIFYCVCEVQTKPNDSTHPDLPQLYGNFRFLAHFLFMCVKINEGKCPTKPSTVLTITTHS